VSNVIPIDEVVRISVSNVPMGLGTPNINNVAIFSTECRENFGDVRYYISMSQIAEDFPTSSLTYSLATEVFAQTPNPLSSQASVAIVRISAIDATQATWASKNISANIANFKLIANGAFTLVTGEDTVSITDLDFRNVTSVSDVAKVIDDATDGYPVFASGNSIVISSKSYGVGTQFTIGAPDSGTDITGANYLNVGEDNDSLDGTNSSGESVGDAVIRAQEFASFVGFMTVQKIETAAILPNAQKISALDKIWMCPIFDDGGIEVAKSIRDASLCKTRMLYYSTSYLDAQLFAAAYMGRAFCVNFSGSSTVQTMNLKELVGIAGDPGKVDSVAIKEAGIDVYGNFGKISRTITSGGNTHFDRVYNQLAIKFQIQYDVFNLIATTITKIPQTEQGMDAIKSVIAGVMQRFVRNGFIAPGTWNSANTFGDPAIFKANISQAGYYIYSNPIADQPQSEREQRIAPLIQVACKESGAIHYITISVVIEA
jgi:hypothetical protein